MQQNIAEYVDSFNKNFKLSLYFNLYLLTNYYVITGICNIVHNL